MRGLECPLTKEELLEVVQEEARRRVSPEFLCAVEEEERKVESDGTETIARMQEEVMTSFGHHPDLVDVLRSARYWYPGVQEFWDVPIQVRENIMRECRLNIGDLAPNLKLYTMDGDKKSLFDHNVLTVLLSGSYS